MVESEINSVSEWGFNPESISAAGTMIAAVALAVAIFGAFKSIQRARKERSLQAFLVLSIDMRKRWESGWRKLLREDLPNMTFEERESPDVILKLEYMLNWLSWIGLIIKMDLVDRQLIFGTLRHVILDILHPSCWKIQQDLSNPEKGQDWWEHIVEIASAPEISFDIEHEANRIEQIRRKYYQSVRERATEN